VVLRPGEVGILDCILAGDLYEFLLAQPCFNCGGAVGEVKGSVSGRDVIRLYCHSEEHSCYQEQAQRIVKDWPWY
jgi:hypothetical protein